MNKSAKSQKIRLLIADDHAIVRFGLSSLLEYEDDIEIAAVAEDGGSALKLAKKHKPDIAIVDLAMPGMNGVETLSQLKRELPAVKVIIYTSFGTSAELLRAVDAKADGIVLKDEGNDKLLQVIRAVAGGERVIPDELKHAKRIVLDDRERELLSALARGLSNVDISTMTGLSRDVVKHALSDLFARLGVATRAEAAALAIERGLIPAR